MEITRHDATLFVRSEDGGSARGLDVHWMQVSASASSGGGPDGSIASGCVA